MKTSRRKWFYLLIPVLLVPGLRELGMLQAEYYHAEAEFELFSKLNGVFRKMTWDNPVHAASLQRLSSNVLRISVDERTYFFKVGVGTDTLDVDLAYEVDGVVWIPLYKSFTVRPNARASIIARRDGEDSRMQLSVNTDGEVDMAISGFCSYREARECIRRKLAETVAERIRECFQGVAAMVEHDAPEIDDEGARMLDNRQTSDGSFDEDTHRIGFALNW